MDLSWLEGHQYWYRSHVDKEYIGNGKYRYTCTVTHYRLEEELSSEIYRVWETPDTEPSDEEPEIVGVIQREYPSIYNTITSIADLNIDGGKYISHEKGLLQFCANCSALETFNIDTDFELYFGRLYDNAYAFLNCTNLREVYLGDELSTDSSYCTGMFRNCTALTTVSGVINIGFITMYKDMFKNCPNVVGLNLKDPNNKLMADPEIEGFVGVGYEYLGLTSTDQFSIIS